MTPQCDLNLHYKQPLLNSHTQVKFFTNTAIVDSGSRSRNRSKAKGNNKSRSRCRSPKQSKKDNRKTKIKCVIVGDQAVGKTALVVSYSNDTFPSEYVPTAYDKYNVVVLVDGEPINVELCDTGGEEVFTRLRNLCYPETDVFILCFSVVDRKSFLSACKRWAEELTRLEASVVLVGTQADLRYSEEVRGRFRTHTLVSRDEAMELADRLGAPYVETSAKTCTHLKEAFDLAITVGLRKHKKQHWWRRLCCL